MGTAIKHPVPDRVKPGTLTLSPERHAQPWASKCPHVKNYKWRLNPVWHRMLYSCTHMATEGVKELTVRPHIKPVMNWVTPNVIIRHVSSVPTTQTDTVSSRRVHLGNHEVWRYRRTESESGNDGSVHVQPTLYSLTTALWTTSG